MTHALAAVALLLAMAACTAPAAEHHAATSPMAAAFVAATPAMGAPQPPFDDTPVSPVETSGASRAE